MKIPMMHLNFNKPQIQVVEWKQYKGETITVNTTIRKGQRIMEKAF